MPDDVINVEKIMEEIRREIKEKGLTNDVLSFENIPVPDELSTSEDTIGDFDRQKFLSSSRAVNRSYRVSLWRPLSGSRLKQFVKKVIRRLIRPIVQPVIEDQTAFNSAVMRNLNEVRNYVIKNDDAEKSRDKQYADLLKKAEQMEKELSELRRLCGRDTK
ncbi:MAG: hypothetical protein ACI4NN_06355 [Pyramidobacter sp.]